MAVKADDKTSRLMLRDARALVTDAFGSPQLAERLIVDWLETGKVRWSCQLIQKERWSPPEKVDGDWREPAFWRRRNPGSGLVALYVNWQESWARRDYLAWGIIVSRTDLSALVPGDEQGETGHGAKAWIVAEARTMKAAGEIPPDIRITEFANRLAHRMHQVGETDRSIRPIKGRSIKNKLAEWGLWPVTGIK